MAACTRRAGLLMVAAVFAVLVGCEDKDDFFGPIPGPPGPPPPVQQFLLRQVSTGQLVTCGIGLGSPAFCWGSNQTGALGIGSAGGPNDFRTVPTLVVGGLSFKAIATSGEHTCAITDGGQAFCWGANEHGELGTTSATTTCNVEIGAITSVPCATSPVPVAGGLTFASIVTATDHTCGVTTGGQGFCWGDNDFGQLGTTAALQTCTVLGTTAPCALTPVPVAGGLTFASINTGTISSHTCGVTTSGDAFCWGANDSGQLGTTAPLDTCTVLGEAFPCALTLVPVAGGLKFASVSAGGVFSCGVTTGNLAFCWGANEAGQLGNDIETCDIPGLDIPCSSVPIAVQGGLTFTQVEAGGSHACGVTTSNQGFCWGSNEAGQVGTTEIPIICDTPTGSFDCFTNPAPVAGGISFQSIDAGADQSCGIATSNQVFCWGGNSRGQVGDGTTTDRPTPVPVSPPAATTT